MGRPGAIVTRMNPHGWIFCGADSICYRVCRFSAKLHSQSSSAPRPVAGAGDPVATGLVESLAGRAATLPGSRAELQRWPASVCHL
jgi:hypothetical protein